MVSRGVPLRNGTCRHFFVSSGALAYDGKGWPWEWPLVWTGIIDPTRFVIVSKSLTRNPRQGNMHNMWLDGPRVVRFGRDWVVNGVGLSNPGIDWWISEVYPRLDRQLTMIPSIVAFSVKDAIEMIELLQALPGIEGIELNVSCPNTGEDHTALYLSISKAAVRTATIPLILKVSYADSVELILGASEGYAAIHAINSVPWILVFGDQPSPLEYHPKGIGKGGVSGPRILPYMLERVRVLGGRTTIPIIAGGGIYSLEAAHEAYRAGAAALSFGTVFLRKPWRANKIVATLCADSDSP